MKPDDIERLATAIERAGTDVLDSAILLMITALLITVIVCEYFGGR